MPDADIERGFEALISLVEAELRDVNDRGQNAFVQREYERAARLVEDGQRLQRLAQALKALKVEWRDRKLGRAKPPRLAGGLRTREERYAPAILEALAARGGRASVPEVRAALETRLGSQLNEFDRARLRSGKEARWWNAAMWCRYQMVERGLLKGGSPRGVWELTEAGWRAAKTPSASDPGQLGAKRG